MRLQPTLERDLPSHAWCCRLARGSDVATVLHGPGVETGADSFVEGAWDGPFGAGRFEEAGFLVGSGGRARRDGLLFAAPSHDLEALYTLRRGPELLVANSLAFLLGVGDLELDLGHPGYFFDVLAQYQAGLTRTDKGIELGGGLRIARHEVCNLVVGSDLGIVRTPRAAEPEPLDYHSYVTGLESTLGRVIENAADGSRRQRFRPVTTLSRGYDSVAISALAARLGCREAVSFRSSPSRGEYIPDSGDEIADVLGLELTLYERNDFDRLAGLPDVEFCLNPFAMTGAIAVMQEQLRGSVLLTGADSDNVWSIDRIHALPDLRRAHEVLFFGYTMSEFRLRCGFVHFPLCTYAARHAPGLHRIARSPAMAPWAVGGEYDKPLPRRIAEEAGVPRAMFGQRKAGGNPAPAGGTLSTAGEADFRSFLQAEVEPLLGPAGPARSAPPGAGSTRAGTRLGGLVPRSARRLARRLIGARLDPRWGSRRLYVLHWGHRRLASRYRVAGGMRERG